MAALKTEIKPDEENDDEIKVDANGDPTENGDATKKKKKKKKKKSGKHATARHAR